MKTVYKYRISRYGDETLVSLPKGAKVLHAALQRDPWSDIHAVIWAEVDTDVEENEGRFFVMHGTGHELEGDLSHISTCLADDGYVWHFFERKY